MTTEEVQTCQEWFDRNELTCGVWDPGYGPLRWIPVGKFDKDLMLRCVPAMFRNSKTEEYPHGFYDTSRSWKVR